MVEPINISTLVVKGLTLIFVDESLASTKTCANTKFCVQCYNGHIYVSSITPWRILHFVIIWPKRANFIAFVL